MSLGDCKAPGRVARRVRWALGVGHGSVSPCGMEVGMVGEYGPGAGKGQWGCGRKAACGSFGRRRRGREGRSTAARRRAAAPLSRPTSRRLARQATGFGRTRRRRRSSRLTLPWAASRSWRAGRSSCGRFGGYHRPGVLRGIETEITLDGLRASTTYCLPSLAQFEELPAPMPASISSPWTKLATSPTTSARPESSSTRLESSPACPESLSARSESSSARTGSMSARMDTLPARAELKYRRGGTKDHREETKYWRGGNEGSPRGNEDTELGA